MDRSFGGFFSSSGGGSPKTPTTNQLAAGDYISPDNVAGVATYLMPTTPADLATVRWIEGPVSFATNKLVFQNTDKPIMGLEEPLEITTAGAGGLLVYFANLGFWKVYLDTQAGKTGSNGGGSSQVINQLAITSPTQDQSGVQANFGLTSTPFSTTPALADTFLRYEWQLAADSSFNNLLWVGTTATNSATPSATIPSGTRVYARVRSVGVTYGAGAWSPVVSFVVAAIAGPTTVTIAGTQLASGGVTHQFTVQSSAWNGSGTHTATQVQVLTTGGTVVYDSGELAGAIVSHKPFDNAFRPTNLTDYVAKVRYKLSTGQWTNFTSSNLRTGNGTFTTTATNRNTVRYSTYSFNAWTAIYTYNGGYDPYGGGPGPYYVCDSVYNQGPDNYTYWICNPSNPEASRPPNSTGPISVGIYTYPRTAWVTAYHSNVAIPTSTSYNTTSWTEW